MHIQHVRHDTGKVRHDTEKLGHDGHEYVAVRPGVFEVPDHVGHELTQRAEWEQYFGEVPYEVSSAGPAAEDSPASEARRPRSRSQRSDSE